MMKILKVLLTLLAVLLVAFLVAGLFIKKDFEFQMTRKMKVPREKVWENVATLKNHDRWSQWRQIDPAMQVTYSGIDGQPGSSMEWESQKEGVGNGKQTISKVTGNERIDFNLLFGGSYEAQSYISVSGDSTETEVTWWLGSHASYPFNTIAYIMMDKSKMDEMFSKGFDLLEKASK